MNYLNKYLKYKKKYLNLKKQMGGSLLDDILVYKSYTKEEMTGPQNISKNESDEIIFSDNESTCDIKNIFNKICTGIDFYDLSLDRNIFYPFDNKIKKYLKLNDFEEFGITDYNIKGPLEQDWNKIIKNRTEIIKCLKNIFYYIEAKDYINKGDGVVRWENANKQSMKMSRNKHNGLEPDKYIIRKSNKHIYIRYISNSSSKPLYYEPVYYNNDRNKVDSNANLVDLSIYEEIELPEFKPYELDKMKGKILVKKLEDLPDDFNFNTQDYYISKDHSPEFDGEQINIDLKILKPIYLEYGIEKDNFEKLYQKLKNNTITDMEIKNIYTKLKIPIVIYLILTKNYNISPFTTIWDNLKKWDEGLQILLDNNENIINSFIFTHKNKNIFNANEINIFKNIINTRKIYLNKFSKIFFKNNNYNSLTYLFQLTTNYYDPNTLSQDILNPLSSTSFHIGYLLGMDKYCVVGAVAHELGHNIFENPILWKKMKPLMNKLYNSNKFYFKKYPIVYREFVADIYSVLFLDSYLKNCHKNNDEKFEIIRNWFRWNCTKNKQNSMESGHPHNEFRSNTLLISKQVRKVICAKYQK